MPRLAPRKPGRQAYCTVADTEDDVTHVSRTSRDGASAISVIILDYSHQRFTVDDLDPHTDTVRTLQERGYEVHHVPTAQQRLIYQGKPLSDADQTLADCGIQDQAIVHLFPKPRVVVVNNANADAVTAAADDDGGSGDDDNNNDSPSGARVPTIVMDQAEADRRGQILVLGSVDYMEAVHNVKFFSFMLLIVSLIELLNLSKIAMGGGAARSANHGSNSYSGENQTPITIDDDFFNSDSDDPYRNSTEFLDDDFTNTTTPSSIDPNIIFETWSALSWLDAAASMVGVYVALLGLRASNENQLATAKRYLHGTCVAAVGWLVYNYCITVRVDEAVLENDNEESVYNDALQVMVLPALVWSMCIFRAWQFQHLLAEAEREAADRILASTSDEEAPSNDDNDSGPILA